MDLLPSTLTSDDDVHQVLHNEYCKWAGCSLELFLNSMKTPPLTTILRFNLPDENRLQCTTEQDEIIKQALQAANEDRLLGRTVTVKAVSGIPGTWICQIGDGCESSDWRSSPGDCSVIVDLSAGEAILRGANLYAQGVLGCSSSIRMGQRIWVFCDVKGKCLKGRKAEFTEELYYVGSGIAELSRSDIFTFPPPTGIAINIDRPRYALLSLNEFLTSHPTVYAQNLPSCVAVQVLNPQPKETILDACAAPGGKTLHIASLMRNTGQVVACDKSAERARRLTQLTVPFRNVKVYHTDVCKLDHDIPRVFDRILVDAPCSASGQRPRLSLRSLRVNQLAACPLGQKRILRAVVPLLKSGGFLVYSTCSILTRENEDVVAWVLQEFPQLSLCQQVPRLGGPGFPVKGLSSEQSECLQRFSMIPSMEGDSIGFFIALFRKTDHQVSPVCSASA